LTPPSKRILSIWLPRLAIERWAKASDYAPDAAVALVVEGAHGQLISAVTDAAREGGARVAMRLTDARALDPELVTAAADVAGDAALLERLALWASRWSPLVEVDGADRLRMDVTGAAHLFGGEEGLRADIEQRFARLGLTTSTAIASTAGAAWALARYPSRAPGEGIDRLAPLPIAALRLSPEANHTLGRLGLKTIGALAGVPRRSLARRFREADNPIDALDRALGRRPEPLTALVAEPPPRATLRLAEPVADPAILASALARLADPLARSLAARRLGARRVALIAWRVDGEVREAAAETSLPTRDAGHLVRLLAEKVATIDPGFGIDAFALEARWCEPLSPGQEALVGEPPRGLELARLIDRLVVRLGRGRVRRPAPVDSHLPERASKWVSGIVASPSPPSGTGKTCSAEGSAWSPAERPSPSPLRGSSPPALGGVARCPQRLLDHPEPIGVLYATPEGLPRRFIWRRVAHDIARVEGPERIAPEWWREPAHTRLRDYYRVEDSVGRRFWIFRQGLVGDGRGGVPQWFLHGLFG
jgi:protein ImuB